MNKNNNKKQIQVFIFICIAVITLGIGYAAISSIILTINGTGTASVNSNNFNVHFDTTVNPTITANMGSATIDGEDNKVAHIAVTGLTKVGDTATAEYTVINESNGVGTEISLELTNTNTSYFKVTETIVKKQLPAGQSTKVRIIVELLKTPIEDTVSTDITGTLTAEAIENAYATATSGTSVQVPTAFASDSWATIKAAVQNNNTSAYNIGDTKEVTINNVDYTVRLANKSTGDHCGDLDTAYSQTACGFVVEFVDIITKMKMQNSNTNVGGYPATLVYDYLNNTLPSQLPPELQSAIKPTRVISGYSTTNGTDSANFTSINQSLYLLSGEEVFGTDGGGNNFYDTAVGTSHQLEYYSNNSVTCSTSSWNGTNLDKAIKQYNDKNTYWWLRPAYSDYSNGFANVSGNGGWNGSYANNAYGVAPAFRIE